MNIKYTSKSERVTLVSLLPIDMVTGIVKELPDTTLVEEAEAAMIVKG